MECLSSGLPVILPEGLQAAVDHSFVFSGFELIVDGSGVQALVQQLSDGNRGIAIFFKTVESCIPKTMLSRCCGKDFSCYASVNHNTAMAGSADREYTGAKDLAVLDFAPRGAFGYLHHRSCPRSLSFRDDSGGIAPMDAR